MKRNRSQGSPDYVLLGTTLFLVFFGLIVLSSASLVLSQNRYGNTFYYLVHQLIFGALPGIILMSVASVVSYTIWRRLAPVLMLVSIGTLVLVLIPNVGIEIGGAKRWLNLGITTFQPSELAKLSLILYLAAWFDKKQHSIGDLVSGYIPSLIIVGLFVGLIYLQPDLGTLIIISLIAASMFFVAGTKLRHLATTAVLAFTALYLAIRAAPYRVARLVTFLDPSYDPQGIGYHVNQALLAVGSGGLLGYGFNRSLQKYNYLPEPMTDSVFAIMAEEMGFIRTALIVAAFAVLIYSGFKVAQNAPDDFSRLLAVGITSWIGIQTFINIGALIGILPLTGIPLPFLSYGSSNLIVTLLGIGILLNISKHAHK